MPSLSSQATFVLGARPRTMRSRIPRLFAYVVAAFVVFVSSLALAADWTPPPLNGHVVDQAGALTERQKGALDHKLDRARQQTGFAIVVYLLPSLPEGVPIEDVAYKAFNTWGVGSRKGDDGVLLVAAVADRKLRIETGKGVGGALTDVQSSHINRDVIGPLMKEGRTYEAMNRGVDAILQELIANSEGGKSETGRAPEAARPAPPKTSDYVRLGVWALVLIGVIVLAIISPTFREILFWLLLFGRGGGGGGSGYGGGGGGGSGYGGGGGRSGGGGSSDDY